MEIGDDISYKPKKMLASVMKLRLESDLQIADSVIMGIVFPLFCPAILILCSVFIWKIIDVNKIFLKNFKYVAW